MHLGTTGTHKKHLGNDNTQNTVHTKCILAPQVNTKYRISGTITHKIRYTQNASWHHRYTQNTVYLVNIGIQDTFRQRQQTRNASQQQIHTKRTKRISATYAQRTATTVTRSLIWSTNASSELKEFATGSPYEYLQHEIRGGVTD